LIKWISPDREEELIVVFNHEEELLPACSTSSRESNYHDSQGDLEIWAVTLRLE